MNKGLVLAYVISFCLLCACLYLAQRVSSLKDSNDYLKSFMESVIAVEGCHDIEIESEIIDE